MKAGRRSLPIAYLALALAAVPMGCGGVDREVIPTVLISLSVTPANPSIAPGTTMQFTATGTYSNGGQGRMTQSVSWASSNTAIANVSNAAGSKGLATATATAGSATITASFGGFSSSATLTTSPVASLMVMPPAPPSIAPGTTRQFTVIGTLENHTFQDLTAFASWTSSEPEVASIGDLPDTKGLATARTAGTAALSAAFGGVLGTAMLTCSSVASISVTPASARIAKGTTQQFAATGALEDDTEQDLSTWVSWSSSAPGAATISSGGLAAGVEEGSAFITATFDGVTSNQAALTVTPAVLASIAVTPVNPVIPLGRSRQFIATGMFSDSATQDITSLVAWESSKTSVATISNVAGSRGLATSAGAGSTTIKAVLNGISGSTALTVTPAVLEAIIVSPAAASIFPGLSQQFTASGHFSDGSTQDLTTSVTWSSSDALIADFIFPGAAGLAQSFTSGSITVTASFSGLVSNTAMLTVQF